MRDTHLRHDALHDEWVAVAAHRQTRTHLPTRAECPLCPSTSEHRTEIPASTYDVAVIDNRFPAFGGPSGGQCEVVCFSPNHAARFADLSAAEVRTVIDAWADRTAELNEREDVAQVFVFENRGEEIGVTLHHPHGQIYALPFIAPRTRRMLDVLEADPAVLRSQLARETGSSRLLASNDSWLAFVPEAARWPVEVHLYPRRQVPDLAALDDDERASLADLYPTVLRAFDRLYDAPLPYIAAWHQVPSGLTDDRGWLRCELFSIRRSASKLKYLAGSESAMGVFVNDVEPEVMAGRLRDVLG